MARLQRALRRMMRTPEALPFCRPVDPVALHIPDYFDIIKNPMDLGTVMDKAKNGELTAADDFAKHMRLVFSNAMLYNPVGHPIHIYAKNLANQFERDYARITLPKKPHTTRSTYHQTDYNASKSIQPSSLVKGDDDDSDDGDGDVKDEDYQDTEPRRKKHKETRGRPRSESHKAKKIASSRNTLGHPSSEHPRGSTQSRTSHPPVDGHVNGPKPTEPVSNTLVELRKAMSSLQHEIESLRTQQNPQPGLRGNSGTPSPSDSGPSGNNNHSRPKDSKHSRRPTRPRINTHPMSLQEKQKLGENIKSLPVEKLGQVVNIIQERAPLKTQSDGAEFEIDLEILDNATLRALESYVLSVSPNPTVRSTSRKRSQPSKSLSAARILEQAQATAIDTRQQILDVERQLGELEERMGSRRKQPGEVKKPRTSNDPQATQAVPAVTSPQSPSAELMAIPKVETDSSENAVQHTGTVTSGKQPSSNNLSPPNEIGPSFIPPKGTGDGACAVPSLANTLSPENINPNTASVSDSESSSDFFSSSSDSEVGSPPLIPYAIILLCIDIINRMGKR